jgi:hypothetical protein
MSAAVAFLLLGVGGFLVSKGGTGAPLATAPTAGGSDAAALGGDGDGIVSSAETPDASVEGATEERTDSSSEEPVAMDPGDRDERTAAASGSGPAVTPASPDDPHEAATDADGTGTGAATRDPHAALDAGGSGGGTPPSDVRGTIVPSAGPSSVTITAAAAGTTISATVTWRGSGAPTCDLLLDGQPAASGACTSLTAANLAYGKTYEVYVVATAGSGRFESNHVSVTTAPPPTIAVVVGHGAKVGTRVTVWPLYVRPSVDPGDRLPGGVSVHEGEPVTILCQRAGPAYPNAAGTTVYDYVQRADGGRGWVTDAFTEDPRTPARAFSTSVTQTCPAAA